MKSLRRSRTNIPLITYVGTFEHVAISKQGSRSLVCCRACPCSATFCGLKKTESRHVFELSSVQVEQSLFSNNLPQQPCIVSMKCPNNQPRKSTNCRIKFDLVHLHSVRVTCFSQPTNTKRLRSPVVRWRQRDLGSPLLSSSNLPLLLRPSNLPQLPSSPVTWYTFFQFK